MAQRTWIVTAAASLLAACAAVDADATADPSTPPTEILSPPAPATIAESSFAMEPSTAASKPVPLVDDEALAVLDTRLSRTQPRSVALLTTERDQLAVLLNATSSTAADRPLVLRRLAEDEVELAQAAEREAPNGASIAANARRAAITHYAAIVQPGSGVRSDEVEWYLALECARAGDVAASRTALARLLGEHPASRFASHADLLSGIMFAAEASADPAKHALAAQSFSKAARSIDGRISRLALQRLEREKRVMGNEHDDAAGCTMDIQCKGVRICRAGQCADP